MRVIFLDRDGVINRYPGDADYVKSWDEFHFLPQVLPSLKKLNDKGFKIFIISNQAGVSKGIFSQEDLDLITNNMLNEFKKHNIYIAGVYYCTHREEDNCLCRKPKTGLIDAAIGQLKKQGGEVELSKSYFIGDTVRDVETGKSAGLKTIMVMSGKEKAENKDNWHNHPYFTARDLSEAADLILNEPRPS